MTALKGRETGRRPKPGLTHGSLFDAASVSSIQRRSVHRFAELNLKNHMAPVSEAELADDQIELPHPAETLAKAFRHALAIDLESALPRAQRFRIMQAQDFHIGDPEPCLFNRRQ